VTRRLISIIVPIHNESKNIPLLYSAILKQFKKLSGYQFELVMIDDGSRDDSLDQLQKLALKDRRLRILEFARNFGKEAATSAGLHEARGDAAILIDADLQHPPEHITTFIGKWEKGADVVVGVREGNSAESFFKRFCSKLFYRLFGLVASTNVVPNATDYRLLDRSAIDTFDRLTEHNRMTRGLIDWLGYRRAYVKFTAAPRAHGRAAYSLHKLFDLAINSFTSHSLLPLKLAGYLGVLIITVTVPLGLFMYIEKYLLTDPFDLRFTGTAMLAVLILFLVGIILFCMGLIALYIARIHVEVMNRPLYVVRERKNHKKPKKETIKS
jgi:glycosyltransferase involved in cell wall biosynthesis